MRVLVADDSTTSRELLVSLLSADPAIEVVGQAANGVEAVEMTSRLRPSLVVMDIHMPVMDGFEATKRIMIEAPTPVVIVTGAANARGVEMSLRAVQMGALTVLPKPPGPGDGDFEAASRRLVSIAKALSQVTVVRRWRNRAEPRVPAHPPAPFAGVPVEVLAIAASTGGPPALYRLLEGLPRTTRVPVLVVQHISEGFAAGLVAWLGSGSPLPVKLAEHGEPLLAGMVYVAPDDRHLEAGPQRRVQLSEGARVDGFRPSATVLFRSVAAVYGASAAGVVLTGMGRDGLEGLTELRRAGGRVLAQDEATSVVFGMPGVVVKAGLADVVAPVEELAADLAEAVGRSR
ncbi:MAG: chemotaxis-specific protein-glutamate methyltransferase CheB [Actinobacteria bacterium]|nr:chemotaxis-specific protein-glutamate methyltransferase CheB [Actinomycetota bacterium]